MPIFKDVVREQTTTEGNGTLSLAGVVLDGFQRFQDALTTGDVVYYEVDDLDIGGSDREEGIGTWTAAGNTLSRDTVLFSTNGGAKVVWGAGVKDVRLTVAATWFTTPFCSMIVGGTLTTSDLSFKTTSGVGTTGADMHFLVGNNGATEAMTILNSGNVGIGTTAPNDTLQVGATWDSIIMGTGPFNELGTAPYIGFNAFETSSAGVWDTVDAAYDGIVITGTPSNEDDSSKIRIGFVDQADGSESTAMTIKKHGKVGIGTTGPARLLHPELADAVVNAVSYIQRLSHISSGTVAAGFGAGIEFELETATNLTKHIASTLESSWITPTAAAEASRFDINVVKASALLAVAPFTVTSAGTGGGVMINKQIFHDAEDANTVSGGNETTIDWSLGNVQKLDLTAEADAITAIFTAPSGPAHLTLRIIQNATARDITWPVTVKWDSDTEPVWTDHDAKTVVLVFYFDGTAYYGALAHISTT